jgi:hypothetical protein
MSAALRRECAKIGHPSTPWRTRNFDHKRPFVIEAQ